MAVTNGSRISVLNSLLRGELAAIETYQQALEKVGAEPGAEQLRHIHHEHRDSANSLRQLIHDYGGQPDQSSGAWGTFAKTMEATGKLFGNYAAVRVLKEGEEQGLRSYEEALRDEDLAVECKTLISQILLPQTRAHIRVLEHLMPSM
jgi:uncharacterized protein (TIGR02284 family)